MRRRFHALAGAAGALLCGLAATVWCALAPPRFAAATLVTVDSGGAPADPYEFASLRALAASDTVLRKAALAPDAAPAIARAARPGPLAPLLGLLSPQAGAADTLTRAADLLAGRVEVDGAPGGALRFIARMDEPEEAARVADAVAQAVVAAHNETAARIDRRLDRSRGGRLARAERRRDTARARLASLRAADMAPTASIAAAAQSAPSPAAVALAEAQRAAATAEAKRAEAARIYGPRHPEMIQIETEAARARAALRAASRATGAQAASPPAAQARPLAEGGPDPRGPALLEAEAELDQAEAAYAKEAARFAEPERRARVAEPAKAAAGTRAPAPATIAVSALLGFLLFGAAPAIGAGGGPARPHARLRRGRLDRREAQGLVDALEIAASPGARRVLVAGDDPGLVRRGACAVATAAAEAGWAPLVIGNADDARGAPRGPVALDGRRYAVFMSGVAEGAFAAARPAAGPLPARDADCAYDLALFDKAAPGAGIEVVIWVGAAAPPRRIPHASAEAARLWIAPAQGSAEE